MHRKGALASSFDIEGIFNRHADTVYRVCMTYLRVPADAEDITQQVFTKLAEHPRAFVDVEHEKAWLITCAANAGKDVSKRAGRPRAAKMPSDVEDTHAQRDETLEAVLALKDPPRICVYLFYYEGYTSDEIAKILDANASTVRNWLAQGREQLKGILKGETA